MQPAKRRALHAMFRWDLDEPGMPIAVEDRYTKRYDDQLAAEGFVIVPIPPRPSWIARRSAMHCHGAR